MNLQLTRIYGVMIGALAIIGLFVSGHLFLIMNTDMALDLLRVVLAVYLLYAGFISKAENIVNNALLIVGAMYIVMGIAGLISPTLGGILPSGLTGFDAVFHLASGALAIYSALSHGSHRHVGAHA